MPPNITTRIFAPRSSESSQPSGHEVVRLRSGDVKAVHALAASFLASPKAVSITGDAIVTAGGMVGAVYY